MLSTPTLPLVAIVGLLFGLNPITLSIMIGLVAGGFGKKQKRSYVQRLFAIYILSLGGCLAIFGTLAIVALDTMPQPMLTYAIFGIATLAVLLGALNLAAMYANQTGAQLPCTLEQRIHARTTKKISLGSACQLGSLASLAVCILIGIPLLALCAVISVSGATIATNIAISVGSFLLPTIIIGVAVLRGTSIAAVIAWKEETKTIMYITLATISIVLGWLLFLWVGGAMEFMS